MARLPRLTLADLAYHVTQRGNRRQAVFFTEADRHGYLALLKAQADHHDLEIWAYCLRETEGKGKVTVTGGTPISHLGTGE